MAAQPKPGGGYYLWACDRPDSIGLTSRYDSTTQSWTTFQSTVGNPRNIPGAHCVDAAGNFWVFRVLPDGFNAQLDCRRPDGTWIGVPPPPVTEIAAFRAKGNLQALCVDQNGQSWKFNGATWSSLGTWRPGRNTMDIDTDVAGNIWVSGVEGAACRTHRLRTWRFGRFQVVMSSG